MKLFEKEMLDILEWNVPDASANDQIVYKHPRTEFITGSYLVVRPSQEALFMDQGNALEVFKEGTRQLDTENTPFLRHLHNIATKGETAWKCEVFFVNKVYLNDLRWGTPTPIQMQDPIEGVNIHVGANGLFGAHIENTRLFLQKVTTTRAEYNREELGAYLRGKIVERVTNILGQTMVDCNVGILQVSSHFQRLSDAIKEQLTPFFAEYGIGLDNFSFMSIKAPDEDLQAINESKIASRKMVMEAEAMAKKRALEGYTYQQERGYDILGTAAANEGGSGGMGSGSLMNAGIGLGMGMGLGGAFGAGMANVAQQGFSNMNAQVQQGAAQGAAAGGSVCPDCNAPVAQGAKFCNNCGKKLGNFCPKCGAEIAQGAKFCNNCGEKLVSSCPKCGTELAPGAKFCNNCGEKI